MLAAPSIAIDFPLKILIWEDSEGKVWVSYNSPAYYICSNDTPAEGLAAKHSRDRNLGRRNRRVIPSIPRIPASR